MLGTVRAVGRARRFSRFGVVGRHFRASSSRIHVDAKSPIIGRIAESVSEKRRLSTSKEIFHRLGGIVIGCHFSRSYRSPRP